MDPFGLDAVVDRLKKEILPEIEAILTNWIDRAEAVVTRLDGASVTLNLKKEKPNETPSINPSAPGAIGTADYGTKYPTVGAP